MHIAPKVSAQRTFILICIGFWVVRLLFCCSFCICAPFYYICLRITHNAIVHHRITVKEMDEELQTYVVYTKKNFPCIFPSSIEVFYFKSLAFILIQRYGNNDWGTQGRGIQQYSLNDEGGDRVILSSALRCKKQIRMDWTIVMFT